MNDAEAAGRGNALPADPYRTGEPAMDGEHLRLFTALQRLEESLQGPHGLETLGDRLRQLEALALEHFRSEEDLLERVGYPHLELHRAEHETIIDHCHAVLDQFSSPDSPPLESLAGRLQALLLRHVETVDRDYADFLERAGLQAGLPGEA